MHRVISSPVVASDWIASLFGLSLGPPSFVWFMQQFFLYNSKYKSALGKPQGLKLSYFNIVNSYVWPAHSRNRFVKLTKSDVTLTTVLLTMNCTLVVTSAKCSKI